MILHFHILQYDCTTNSISRRRRWSVRSMYVIHNLSLLHALVMNQSFHLEWEYHTPWASCADFRRIDSLVPEASFTICKRRSSILIPEHVYPHTEHYIRRNSYIWQVSIYITMITAQFYLLTSLTLIVTNPRITAKFILRGIPSSS